MSQKRKRDDLTSEEIKKRTRDNLSSKQCTSVVPIDGNFLEDTNIFIVPASIEKTRLKIFTINIQKYGGKICNTCDDNDCSHIVVDESVEDERLCRILDLQQFSEEKATKIVRTTWLTQCFRQKRCVESDQYEIDIQKFCKHEEEENEDSDLDVGGFKSADVPDGVVSDTDVKNDKIAAPKVGIMWSIKKKYEYVDTGSGSDYQASDDDNEAGVNSGIEDDPGKKTLPVGSWICAHSSKSPKQNFNVKITEKLQAMVKAYESTNEKWRAFSYQKAISALRKYPKEITTWEEARSLPGIGAKLADKIWEIVQSGELRKLNELRCDEEVKVLEIFTNVWGAGPTTARAWYQQGFRTLDDLKTKANLTKQQVIGLKHYDDILDRMPNAEAGQIEKVVILAAESLVEGIIAHACGSYRRKKATCGDVDILVTHPDGKSHKGIFQKLISLLEEQGFITDHLVKAEDNGNQKKYLGVCKLPGDNQKHRRLDIIVVPYDEYPCAIVYFTGSAHFNRSLRHLAKKKGMSLSEHALRTGVVRQGGKKIFEGNIVPTPTEESVITKLGIPYRPPEERDH